MRAEDRLSNGFQRLLDRYKPLTADEERALIAKFANNRRALEEALVLHSLRLAQQVAAKHYDRTETEDDLLTIAIMGLVKAARTFDASKGLRFNTFAMHVVRSAFDVITNEGRTDVQTNRATVAVLDEPAEDSEGEDFGWPRVDEIVRMPVSPDWRQPDPGGVHAENAERRECVEWIEDMDRRYLRREKPLNRRIVLGLLAGWPPTRLAVHLGISRRCLYVRARPVLARLRSAVRKEGRA